MPRVASRALTLCALRSLLRCASNMMMTVSVADVLCLSRDCTTRPASCSQFRIHMLVRVRKQSLVA